MVHLKWVRRTIAPAGDSRNDFVRFGQNNQLARIVQLGDSGQNGWGHMRQINSTDFKNHFGEFLDLAKEEPITIGKSGKAVAVVMSVEGYEALQRLEDAFWKARAEAAEASGEWVDPAEAMRVLTSRLKRAK